MIKNLLIDKKKRILFKIFELKKRFLKTVIFDNNSVSTVDQEFLLVSD